MKATAYVDNEHVSVNPLSKWDDKIIEIMKSESNHTNNETEKSASKATSKQALSKTFNASAELEQQSVSSQAPDFFNDTQNEGVVEINDMIATEAATKVNEHEYVNKMLTTVNRYDSQAMEYLFQSLNIAFSIEDKV